MATKHTEAQFARVRALADLFESELLGPCSTGLRRAFFMDAVVLETDDVGDELTTPHRQVEEDLVDDKV